MPRVPAVSILSGVILFLACACSPVPSWKPPEKPPADKSLEMNLWESAQGCDPLSLSALIRAGADVNTPKGPNATTPLMEAAHSYGPDCPLNNLRILLDRGASITKVDKLGNTVLHHLATTECTIGYDQATLVLLKLGADPTIRNLAGLDPITIAAQRGCNTRVALMAEAVAAKKSQHTRPDGPLVPAKPAPAPAGGLDLPAGAGPKPPALAPQPPAAPAGPQP